MWAHSDGTRLSSFPTSSAPPSLESSPMSNSLSDRIGFRQDEYCHAGRRRVISSGNMASSSGTHSEDRAEVQSWTMLSRVGSMLPGIQGHLRQVANTTAPRAAKPPTRLQRMWRGKEKGDPAEGAAGASRDQAAVPDRRNLDLAFASGKGFVSMVASVAAVVRTGFGDSGVDWRPGSQGLDLIMNSSREFLAARDQDYDPEFERYTYISGAQNVLRGLPRDLDPGEAAILRQAMPGALVAAMAPLPGDREGGNGWQGAAPDGGGNRNMVHTFTFGLMCCLSYIGGLVAPKLKDYGYRAIQAEHEHKYIPSLLTAAAALLQILGHVLFWIGECWPCRLFLSLLGYATRGVRGAVHEFGAKSQRGNEGAGNRRRTRTR